MFDLPLLSRTYRDCARKLANATNVGLSDDWDDVFLLVDYVNFALNRQVPGLPCLDGCAHCCKDNALFRMTTAEWRPMEANLAEWPEGKRLLFAKRVCATYAEFRPILEQVADSWVGSPYDSPLGDIGNLPTACPMLDASDRCQVYEVRPLMCRAYGTFAVNVRGTESLLVCPQRGPEMLAALRTHGGETFPLPGYAPFLERVQGLNHGGQTRPLPLFLLDWAEEVLANSLA